MADDHDMAGAAALSLCEALLFSLADHRILTERDVLAILDDAAATHIAPGKTPEATARGAATAQLISRIANGGGGFQRSNAK